MIITRKNNSNQKYLIVTKIIILVTLFLTLNFILTTKAIAITCVPKEGKIVCSIPVQMNIQNDYAEFNTESNLKSDIIQTKNSKEITTTKTNTTMKVNKEEISFQTKQKKYTQFVFIGIAIGMILLTTIFSLKKKKKKERKK